MIPLKITIKNFLSYGAELQHIDFSTYPLICLSGKNGHGKSALLDALTWAVWGHARKTVGTAKADQGLVRLGQTQMMVMLDFSFNEQYYRIKREFMITYGKPYTALELGILDPETDKTIPLTDKTIRETQHKIDSLLKLDYESFINSAFLRQGQANEFSKKTPKERKEVLATILGLNQYEAVRKLAAEKVKTAQQESNHLSLLNEQLAHELLKSNECTAQLMQIQQQLNSLAQQEKEHIVHKKDLEQTRTQLTEHQKKRDHILFAQEQLAAEEQKYQTTVRTVLATWRAVNQKQRKGLDHKLILEQKHALVLHIQEYQQQLQKNLELKEHYLQHKDAMQTAEKKAHEAQLVLLHTQQLTVEQCIMNEKNCIASAQEIENAVKKLVHEREQLQKELIACDNQLKKIALNEPLFAKQQKLFEKRKDFYQRFITYGNMLTQELSELTHKQELSTDEDNPCCPLCEQNLSAARRRFLKTKFVKQESWLAHRRARIKRVIIAVKQQLIEQHALLEQLKKEQEVAVFLTAKQQECMGALQKLELSLQEQANKKHTLQEKLRIQKEQRTQAQQTLEHTRKNQQKSSELVSLQKQVYDIEQQLKNDVYKHTQHRAAEQELKTIEHELHAYAHAQEEIALQSERKTQIHTHCTTLKTIKKQRTDLATHLAAYNTLDAQYVQLQEKEHVLAKQQIELNQTKGQHLQEKGKLEQQKEYLTKTEISHKHNVQKIAQLLETVDEYQTIAQAMGKDGIQALLIEDALPEIEQEANELLSKLTNNQAHIIIESLRDLKKGGIKETLDIKISDPAGMRPYEMFSGGEAFRIDFALRIAISKLLARRAGTSLQTLIIDEGFGSQDEEGLGHIMDALYKIQDDFAKIIIVSHLPAMKDQFPVHFVIDKGPQGSRVHVVEQG